MTGKERSVLRGEANGLQPILHIGKGGVTDNIVIQADDALKARELIKLSVLETSGCTAREVADELAQRTGAEVIQVIGLRAVLYRQNPEEDEQQM